MDDHVLPRLVAVDMDGTFLDSASRYDRPRFTRLAARLQDAGVRFAVASGNQYWQLKNYFDGFDQVLYVAENGALVGTSDQILRYRPISAAALGQTLDLLDTMPEILTLVCGVRSGYVLRSTDPALVNFIWDYYVRLEIVDSWDEIDDQVVKLALLCQPERTPAVLAQLDARLPTEVVTTSSGHGSIDLIPHGVNKGVSLAWLGEQLGIGLDEMIAFGDGGNDIEMLAMVGRGVAMANAAEQVKAVGDEVTASNDEAAVLSYLERLLTDFSM